MSDLPVFFFNLIQSVILIFLSLAILYIWVFSVAGLFYRQKKYPANPGNKKIVVLIPGYREDEVIYEAALHSLRQTYPREFYDIVIIADSFLPETLLKIKDLPVRVIEVSFEKSTKSKSLNAAMSQLPDIYDIAVVLDADNLMASDFLTKINAAFEGRFMAIQGHRTAKNNETPLAALDAISEEINNHIFRKGHRALGLSSAIIGSGMAFRYQFFKKLMASVTAVGGFDKEIELKMLKDGHKIEFLEDAYVYDEKVSKPEVFTNQRRRWLSAQFIYFRQDFLKGLIALFLRGNVDYFDKIVQFIQPPRILLLGIMLIMSPLLILLNLYMRNHPFYLIWWLIAFLITLLSFIFSIPVTFYTFSTLKSIGHLPKGMLLMLGSLLKIKGANKQFIHTQHTQAKVNIKDKSAVQ